MSHNVMNVSNLNLVKTQQSIEFYDCMQNASLDKIIYFLFFSNLRASICERFAFHLVDSTLMCVCMCVSVWRSECVCYFI